MAHEAQCIDCDDYARCTREHYADDTACKNFKNDEHDVNLSTL